MQNRFFNNFAELASQYSLNSLLGFHQVGHVRLYKSETDLCNLREFVSFKGYFMSTNSK